MNLIEFYSACGGNYLELKERLGTNERIHKYLLKFKDNTEFISLKKALDEENWVDAFRFSHNLKGLALNLNLSLLYYVSSDLCENLRGGFPKEDYQPLFLKVEEAYNHVIKAINEFII